MPNQRQSREQKPGFKKTRAGWIPEDWDCVPFSKVFERLSNAVVVQAESNYQEIGIRSHCRGVFYKDPIKGKKLGNKRVYWCQPGALVFNIVFAWEQAVAILGPETDGLIASHRFPMYKARSNRANVDFYLRFFGSPRGKYALGLASPGGAGRNKTLGQRELDFLFLPLPSLQEQLRISRILHDWDQAVSILNDLINAKLQLKKALLRNLLWGTVRFRQFGMPVKTLGQLPSGWRKVQIQNIAEINPTTRRQEQEDSLVTFLAMADVSENGQIVRRQERPSSKVSNGFTSFQNNDILVAKITPSFENGKGAIVSNLLGAVGYGSTEFHVIRAARVCTKLLFYHTQSHRFRARGEANMTGSAGQRRVPRKFIERYSIPLPTCEEQTHIVALLDTLATEVRFLEQQLDFTRKQRQDLVQNLMSGTIRVNEG